MTLGIAIEVVVPYAGVLCTQTGLVELYMLLLLTCRLLLVLDNACLRHNGPVRPHMVHMP